MKYKIIIVMSAAFFCMPSFAMNNPYQMFAKSMKAEEGRRQDRLAEQRQLLEKKEISTEDILRLNTLLEEYNSATKVSWPKSKL